MKARWIVEQAGAGKYKITCPQCGKAMVSKRIEARSRCDSCGAVFGERNKVYAITSDGKLIEKKGEEQRDQGAEDHHQNIAAKALPAVSSFFLKIRQIVLSRGGKHR